MYWLAFITGIFGSLHCLGMCGPIALALPFSKNSSLKTIAPGRVIYNLGRVISYILIGILLGSLGKMLVLAGLQQYLSIISGIILIIIALAGFLGWTNAKSKVNQWISAMFKGRFQSDKLSNMLYIGILNGFLPCGLVYTAATMALEGGEAFHAGMFMLFFGLGTFPLMFMVSLSPGFLSAKRRMKIKNLSPYIALIMGVLFLLRGMNLNIPYISPKIDQEKETMDCCESGEH